MSDEQISVNAARAPPLHSIVMLPWTVAGLSGQDWSAIDVQHQGAQVPLKTRFLISVAAVAALSPAIAPATAQSISSFTEGDVVVSVEGNGGNTGSYTDNQAAPLTLYEYGSSGTGFVGSFELPQTNSGANFAVSGEYGSSSEGNLQLSGNGRYLTIMGYGVNARAFNANPALIVPTQPTLRSDNREARPVNPIRLFRGWLRSSGRTARSILRPRLPTFSTPTIRAALIRSTERPSMSRARAPIRTRLAGCSSRPSEAIPRRRSPARTPEAARRRTPAKCRSTTASSMSRPTASRARPIAITSARSAQRERCRPAKRRRQWPRKAAGFGNSGGTGKITVTAANANNVNAGLIGKDETVNLSPQNYFFANADTLYVADSGPRRTPRRTARLATAACRSGPCPKGTGRWTTRCRRVSTSLRTLGPRIDRSLWPDRQGHHRRRHAGS